MFVNGAAYRAAVALFFLGLAAGTDATAQSIAPATVRTLAGTGAAGFGDGPGARATFLMPSAVAFGPDRTLYVADAAAQRIRAIAPDGVVRTLAGGGSLSSSGLWVAGGFRDGAVAGARFSHPSGLAVRSDGAVYVADTFNHCIRLIASGRVSTVAGRCGLAGNADGKSSAARFEYPRGLALARNGALYIADQKNGIRVLTAAGNLSTMAVPPHVDFRWATGVSAVTADHETVLYVANVDRLVRYGLSSHSAAVVQDLGQGIEINSVQGGGSLGRPYSVYALSQNSILYGDLRDGALRYVEDFLTAITPLPHVQYVGGPPAENSPLGLSTRSSAEFAAPMGIAADKSGRIAVADAIQRKIFLLKIAEARHALGTGLGALRFANQQYRIVIQGNSFVLFSSGFADSIAGLLERRLRNDHALGGRAVKVAALYIGCPDPELLTSGLVDLAVLIVDAYEVDCDGKAPFERDPTLTQRAGSWQQTIELNYGKTLAALSRAHVQAAVLLIPMPWEVSPLETLYRMENIGYYEFSSAEYAFASDYRSAERNWMQTLAPLGAPVINTFPAFRAFELQRHSDTLFATDDFHPSKAGRERAANALADYLEHQKPWAR